MRAGFLFTTILAAAQLLSAAAPAAIRVYEGTMTIPAYQHTGRETQPPLFNDSTVNGLYPFTTYIMPFQPGGPKPKTYRAIFVENEYLKLTYMPDFGGRFFSLYDKVRGREVFYRNDVIKPAHYNPRISWPQSGIEMTGPYAAHMLTLYGEPFWSNKVVRHEDGSVSLVLGELDPVYHMKVNLSATLHPGVAALQMSVFCYNRRDGRMPQMIWLSAALSATPKTRFIYPMTRTIGHTTSEIADWPVYNGIDYSWDRNNQHMLGVFGIDIYDNFQGAYQFDQDYGVFRYADRRIVQGMKMWTFGYSAQATALERAYTDNAGPYIEVQSGRHVWDGNYEWVGPHKVENWSEWWVPVAGIGGLTTITRDVALNLDVQGDNVKVALSAVRVLPGAKVVVRAKGGEILNTTADLAPGKPFAKTVTGAKGPLAEMTATVTDAAGSELMRYRRPDTNPGRQEYTPFTRPLEKPAKSPDQMNVEELVLAAEGKFKGLNATAGTDLLNKALALDPGYSRAHLQFGIHHFNAGRYRQAATHLEKVIERDPYQDEAYYYLAMSQFALGEEQRAERNLYYIWPQSAYFGEREYHLGRLAYGRKQWEEAVSRLERAIVANGYDLGSRQLLAVTYREQGNLERALAQLAEIQRIDPTDRPALAERFFLNGDKEARAELLRLMGGQSQEAIDVSIFYRGLGKWKEAVEVLRMVEQNNKDPWGTPAEFYYTLAYCLKQQGEAAPAAAYREKARAAANNVDRFPYRERSGAGGRGGGEPEGCGGALPAGVPAVLPGASGRCDPAVGSSGGSGAGGLDGAADVGIGVRGPGGAGREGGGAVGEGGGVEPGARADAERPERAVCEGGAVRRAVGGVAEGAGAVAAGRRPGGRGADGESDQGQLRGGGETGGHAPIQPAAPDVRIAGQVPLHAVRDGGGGVQRGPIRGSAEAVGIVFEAAGVVGDGRFRGKRDAAGGLLPGAGAGSAGAEGGGHGGVPEGDPGDGTAIGGPGQLERGELPHGAGSGAVGAEGGSGEAAQALRGLRPDGAGIEPAILAGASHVFDGSGTERRGADGGSAEADGRGDQSAAGLPGSPPGTPRRRARPAALT